MEDQNSPVFAFLRRFIAAEPNHVILDSVLTDNTPKEVLHSFVEYKKVLEKYDFYNKIQKDMFQIQNYLNGSIIKDFILNTSEIHFNESVRSYNTGDSKTLDKSLLKKIENGSFINSGVMVSYANTTVAIHYNFVETDCGDTIEVKTFLNYDLISSHEIEKLVNPIIQKYNPPIEAISILMAYATTHMLLERYKNSFKETEKSSKLGKFMPTKTFSNITNLIEDVCKTTQVVPR